MLIAVVAMFSINYFPVWALPIIDVRHSLLVITKMGIVWAHCWYGGP